MKERWKLLAALLVFLVLATAADAQTKLRFKFKAGERLDYVMDQNQKATMKVAGMDINMKTNMEMHMEWEIKKVDDKGYAQIKMAVSRVKMKMDGGPGGNVEVDSKDTADPDSPFAKVFATMVKAMAGVDLTCTMGPTGEMKDVKFSEEALKKFKSMAGANKLGGGFDPDSFKSMLNQLALPKEAIAKGKTWTQKTEGKTPIGKMITEQTYTYEGPVEKNGRKLERIAVKPNMKIEPNPDAPVKMKLKSNSGKGEILFDNVAGRIVESNTETTSEMEIDAGGMTIESKTVQKMRVTLEKKETKSKTDK